MSADHEYCEHGICLKCEPCELCAAAIEGKRYAAEALRLIRGSASHRGRGEMSEEFTSGYAQEDTQDKTGALDGPACHVCGAIMVLKHELKRGIGVKFFICLSCGTTTGCS